MDEGLGRRSFGLAVRFRRRLEVGYERQNHRFALAPWEPPNQLGERTPPSRSPRAFRPVFEPTHHELGKVGAVPHK